MRILVAGELNADLIFSGLSSLPQPGREVLASDFALALGSSSAICASGLAKLGADVSFIGKVGSDPLGQLCLDELSRLGVDVSRVLMDPTLRTGVTASFSANDRALTTYPGAVSALMPEDIQPDVLRSFTHFHVSSYYLQHALRPGIEGLFRAAREMGLTTSLDPGYDPSENWGREILDVLRHVNVFLLNEVELAALTSCVEIEQGLRSLDNRETLIVAKMGERGCMALVNGAVSRASAIRVNAVDTTGAGDSFNAGFLYTWLLRLPLKECLRCGSICGSLSTRRLGGCAAQPRWEEVLPYLEENSIQAYMR